VVNWLKLQGMQVHSEYCFSAPQCKSVRLGFLFIGRNTVQSGSPLPTFWKQEVRSKRVNQPSSKLKPQSVTTQRIVRT
jgi:hypothetical protein